MVNMWTIAFVEFLIIFYNTIYAHKKAKANTRFY